MNSTRRWVGALALLMAIAFVVSNAVAGGTTVVAQQEQVDVAGRSVVVATKALEPFVFVDGPIGPDGSIDAGDLRGYSVDVWNEMANRLDLDTQWVVRESVGEIIGNAQAGTADVAIAGISMTVERESLIDFTHPYFDAGLQIATTGKSTSSVGRTMWNLFTSRRLLGALGFLMLMVVAISHAVWWSERKHNPEFPSQYREGIVEALWWSTVSVITGGEAVKNINGRISRLIAVLWMVVGLFVLALVTAQATSALTVRQLEGSIQGVEDLGGNRVGTVGGTVAATFLEDSNLSFSNFATVDDALVALVADDLDAVVFDSPVLSYRAATDYSGRVELVDAVFAPDPYAIALSTGSDLREPINAELLAMSRDGTLDAIHLKWFRESR